MPVHSWYFTLLNLSFFPSSPVFTLSTRTGAVEHGAFVQVPCPHHLLCSPEFPRYPRCFVRDEGCTAEQGWAALPALHLNFQQGANSPVARAAPKPCSLDLCPGLQLPKSANSHPSEIFCGMIWCPHDFPVIHEGTDAITDFLKEVML